MVCCLLFMFAVALSAQLLIVTSSGAPVKAPTSPVKSPVAGNKPTKKPSKSPTKNPTKAPTKAPFKAPTKKPSKAPTKKPVVTVPTISPSVRASLIKTQIQKLVGAQNLANTTTPYYRALQWILNTDRMKLGPNAKNLNQRYLTALLYYLTSKSGPWLSCNPSPSGQDEFCNFAKLISVFPVNINKFLRSGGLVDATNAGGLELSVMATTRRFNLN